MLTSLAVIFLSGMFLGWLSKKIHLPSLVGMILAGILFGPSALNLISSDLLDISGAIRNIALVIILTRAGLALDVGELKKAGRPALLMCFLPASFEVLGVTLLAPKLFGITIAEAALTGAVLAAVSPAVVVPRMLKLISENRGTDHQIPQMILAGASADDVFVIVLFTSFTSIVSGGGADAADFLQIPTSIILGAGMGILTGIILNIFFRRVHMRDSAKVIIMLSVSFLFLFVQDFSENYIRVSGLIAVMALGMTVYHKRPELADRLSRKFGKLWTGAEILLFVLVGAAVDIRSVTAYGVAAVLMVFGAMVFRMTGVFICCLGTKLTKKERLFCMLAYTPKATVQAAIGAIPLSIGLECGRLVLTAAVLAILITAPLGAFMIDRSSHKLLSAGNQ
ncbi:MAG: cation:proton antiporter [Huintestinicola sp.]